ncbi:hypothetical protein TrVE_jg12751 [Triparma verrucosa]|uniref:RING-type domain-containing protein n=1 Tax=Triparma verrucosa TaxID=1606542 RepID=A0A9W7BY78_9STRA|nr:hypothetical protein TrVE_jg12751 [Triparma verrucosa]
MSDPSALHCGHVFCESCLLDWTKSKWSCPTCSQPCRVGNEKSIKVNPQMRGITEALRNIENTLIAAEPNWWMRPEDSDVFPEINPEEDQLEEQEEIQFEEDDCDSEEEEEEGEAGGEEEKEEDNDDDDDDDEEEIAENNEGILKANKEKKKRGRTNVVGVRWGVDESSESASEPVTKHARKSTTTFQQSPKSAQSDSSLASQAASPAAPSRRLTVFIEDEDLLKETGSLPKYDIKDSIESSPPPDVVVLQGTLKSSSGLTLSADITWSYLLSLSLGSLIVSSKWLSKPSNQYYTKTWSKNNLSCDEPSTSDSRWVYGHDGCSTLGAPGRMYSSRKKLNKKLKESKKPGTRLFKGYNFFLAGNFPPDLEGSGEYGANPCPPTMSRCRMRRLLELGDAKTVNDLGENSEPTPAKEHEVTKVIVGSNSSEVDVKEIYEVMENIWILGMEEIEVVRVEWVVESICEGQLQELEGGRYLY